MLMFDFVTVGKNRDGMIEISGNKRFKLFSPFQKNIDHLTKYSV